MRSEFIPSTDSLSNDKREVLEHAANLNEAREIAPWACEIVEVEGGFRAFESATDADTWANQN